MATGQLDLATYGRLRAQGVPHTEAIAAATKQAAPPPKPPPVLRAPTSRERVLGALQDLVEGNVPAPAPAEAPRPRPSTAPAVLRAATTGERVQGRVRDLIGALAGGVGRITDPLGLTDFAGFEDAATNPEHVAMGMPDPPAGRAAQGIRAFHGSPHDFDRFALEKIGTGEGAQAYGHGLYFAENEGVARDYRNRLGGAQDRAVEGGGRLPNWVANVVDEWRADPKMARSPDELITEFKARIGEAEERVASEAPQWWNDEAKIPGLREVVLGLENVKAGRALAPKGRMYEVNLKADPEEFLDWDAPLSAQSEKVQAALRQLGVSPKPAVKWQAHQITQQDIADKLVPANYAPGSWIAAVRDPAGRIEWHGGQLFGSEAAAAENAAARSGVDQRALRDKGAEVYRDLPHILADRGVAPRLSERSVQQDATEALRKAGVPGIKYLDQGSRAAKTGTRNYVVFNDQLIDILRKYGWLPPAALLGPARAVEPEPTP